MTVVTSAGTTLNLSGEQRPISSQRARTPRLCFSAKLMRNIDQTLSLPKWSTLAFYDFKRFVFHCLNVQK